MPGIRRRRRASLAAGRSPSRRRGGPVRGGGILLSRAQPRAARRMIRSMTAFASGERAGPDGTLGCEVRAVNHRFLEVGVRLPEELRALEPAIRERVAARSSRGKIDVALRLRAPEAGEALAVDEALVERLGALALALDAKFPTLRTDFVSLLQFPGVLAGRGADPQALQAAALSLLDEVLDGFVAAREREGAALAAA